MAKIGLPRSCNVPDLLCYSRSPRVTLFRHACPVATSWTRNRSKAIPRARRSPIDQDFSDFRANLRTRTELVQSGHFRVWLADRLDSLHQQEENAGFAAFLRRFKQDIYKYRLRPSIRAADIDSSSRAAWRPQGKYEPQALMDELQRAYLCIGLNAVVSQLRYVYAGVAAEKKANVNLSDSERLADLRWPIEWYPATRAVQRVIHLHVGPTNSGKTYQALKRLEQAQSGVYASPLRLLAHEVFQRLNARGKTCDLVTGDEQIMKVGVKNQASSMKSCTVEMVPLNKDFDVAVIDEIQMIGNDLRGWAWTQALLGLKAKELHLCGEERAVPLIKDIVATMGDRLEIHTYQRLSPLKVMSQSLDGTLAGLQKGDCVVSFSRANIHRMKGEIEKATGKRVAIIYGGLPPEIRTQQAKLFNAEDNEYEFLVASDAIGMGLNLAIKRIIFETMIKYNGDSLERLPPYEIKQIAGRAGRYRTAAQANEVSDISEAPPDPSGPPASTSVGLVTTLQRADLPILRKAIADDPIPVAAAGIFPPSHMVSSYAAYFPPDTPLSFILLRLHEISMVSDLYKLCHLVDQLAIADLIQSFENLSLQDRMIFCASPANTKSKAMHPVIATFARCVAENRSCSFVDMPELHIEILNQEPIPNKVYLDTLENLHRSLILYTWLSYRFIGVFMERDLAFHVKALVEERIDSVLSDFSASPEIRRRLGLPVLPPTETQETTKSHHTSHIAKPTQASISTQPPKQYESTYHESQGKNEVRTATQFSKLSPVPALSPAASPPPSSISV